MKHAKLTILITAVIVIAAGIVSTKSASPTALCADEPKEGLCKSPYKEAWLFGYSESPLLETAIGDINCTITSIESETADGESPKGVPVSMQTPNFSFNGCTFKPTGTGCTVKTLNKPYLTLINWTSGSNGAMEFENGGKGIPSVSVVCGTSINCTYAFKSALDLQGGTGPVVVANKETLEMSSGSNCPGTGAPILWTATYAEEEASTLFVADYATPVHLCKKNETPCSSIEQYGAFTTLAATLDADVKTKLNLKVSDAGDTMEYTVACEASTFEASTLSPKWPLTGSVAVSFRECGGTCSVNALKLDYQAEIEASGSGNGSLKVSDGGTGAPRLRVRCIGAYRCTYEVSSFSSTISGGAPAKLAVNVTFSTLVTVESDKTCGPQLKWEGTYKFTKPEVEGEPKMWVVRDGT